MKAKRTSMGGVRSGMRVTTSGKGTRRKRASTSHQWTFLSNHAHVLICLAEDAHVRLRDVATRIGLTERAVQGIVKDLETGGLIQRHREGRRNSYVMKLEQPLRHPIESHRTVQELVDLCSNRSADEKQSGRQATDAN